MEDVVVKISTDAPGIPEVIKVNGTVYKVAK